VRQKLSQLNTILQAEIRERRAADAMGDTKFRSELRPVYEEINRDEQIDKDIADQSERLNKLAHDLESTVTYLKKVDDEVSSWTDSLRDEVDKTQNMIYQTGRSPRLVRFSPRAGPTRPHAAHPGRGSMCFGQLSGWPEVLSQMH
jgi:hypothetical protein